MIKSIKSIKGKRVNKGINLNKGINKGKDDFLKLLDDYGHEVGMSLVYRFGKMFDSQMVPLNSLHSCGNIKIPNTTMIFNMSSATDCPSLALNKCKACIIDKVTGELKTCCYALKCERDYRPNVLPYRQRQQKFWLGVSADEFVKQFMIIQSNKVVKFDKIRLNEAGDFHSQECVNKSEKIARLLSPFGIVVYCYTSRDDLDYTRTRKLVISGSNFVSSGISNEFKMIEKGEEVPKGYKKCPSDCHICDRCSIRGKRTVIERH